MWNFLDKWCHRQCFHSWSSETRVFELVITLLKAQLWWFWCPRLPRQTCSVFSEVILKFRDLISKLEKDVEAVVKLEKEERELAASEAKVHLTAWRKSQLDTALPPVTVGLTLCVCVVECSPEAAGGFQHICSISESLVSDPTGEETEPEWVELVTESSPVWQ